MAEAGHVGGASRPSGAAGEAPDDPSGAVAVQPAPIGRQEDGSFGALADGQVDRPGGARCQRDGDHLAALVGDHQGAVAALDTQGLNAGAGGFGDPQPVQREQRDQRVLAGGPRPEATSSAPSSLRSRPTAWDS